MYEFGRHLTGVVWLLLKKTTEAVTTPTIVLVSFFFVFFTFCFCYGRKVVLVLNKS